MASVFGHALAAIALGTAFNKKIVNRKFWTLGTICSIVPDADVITFKYGIPYESFWGHRGFTHSFLFALIIGVLFTALFYRLQLKKLSSYLLIFYFTLCTASHSILDAMTNGGLGVAFFSPWDNSRYFFQWRPIKVSPIGIDNFLSEWGIQVIMNEIVWIGIPCGLFILSTGIIKKLAHNNSRS